MIRRSLLVLLLAPGALRAQASCADTLAGATWYATPISAVIADSLPLNARDGDRFRQSVIGGLAAAWRDPAAALRPGGGMAQMLPEDQRPPLQAELELVIAKNGRVRAARLRRPSGHAALDSTLLAAARNAGGGRGIGRLPRQLRDSVRLRLLVADRAIAGVPMMLAIGDLQQAMQNAETPPTLRSMPPARARRAGRVREVVLAGVVTRQGRMDPASVRVVTVAARDSALVPIARRSLLRARYRPGTLRGCPASSYVRQTFRFP